MSSKKGAVELSIGTIVIIVLAMSMLILGIVLVKNIFGTGIDVVKMTDSQLKNQVGKLFGEDKRVVVYPDSRIIDVKVGADGKFGIGIKNLLRTSDASEASFSYEVVVDDENIQKKCGMSQSQALGLIQTGGSGSRIQLGSGQTTEEVVTLRIPETANPCIFRYRVNVMAGSDNYATTTMDVNIEP